MYIKVRIKLLSNEITELSIDLPEDIRDFHVDTLSDYVSDHIDSLFIKYMWYRINDESISILHNLTKTR